ncbi:Ku protein [Pelosinus sp. UFO1]|uniref:non-homologous end joining protein Ku n=1 Tax=Pelosinus sp. UFO1 TaxID=484770 RepID=UPI0004D14B9F|nr:Ku protein [Pelosinus sp. UFO1]AIF52162.1 DNA repair protein [Pelosinus sp. UFO1]
MPRPVWSGSISFGLVNIPIKLYNAVKKKTLHFHQLRKSDGCRIRLKRVCANDGSEVPNEEIVKGYEISPEQYVVLSSEEIENVYPKSSRRIQIDDFVRLEEIDPIYFEHSYYLTPDKGMEKAYSLLLFAMKKSQKTAIANFVLRNKQYIAAIRPTENAITLSTMFFSDEIIPQKELEDLPSIENEPDQRELTIALQLIESLSSNFAPEKYHNEYREKILSMIERKAEGQVITQQPAAEQGGKVVDLMAALEASLAALKKKTPAKTRRKKAHA